MSTGPYEIGYISRYLEFMSRPLTRIDNLDEFINFIIKNDVTVSFFIKKCNLWSQQVIFFFKFSFQY